MRVYPFIYNALLFLCGDNMNLFFDNNNLSFGTSDFIGAALFIILLVLTLFCVFRGFFSK